MPFESTPLAPLSIDPTRLPKPLIEEDEDTPLTVQKARGTYIRVERDSWGTDGHRSKHQSHKVHYGRIHEADRRFQDRYTDTTTVKFTRCLHPYRGPPWIDDDMLYTLWELDEMLNGGGVRERVRGAINYQLRDFDFEWVAITSVTRVSGAPREYIYLWIDDPKNEIATDHFIPALEKHIDGCENAGEQNHPYQENGNAGVITIEHTPPLVDDPPKKFPKVLKESKAASQPNSVGARFVASQLAHLPIGNFANSNQDDPPDSLLNGGALAWASSYNWFRASSGVP